MHMTDWMDPESNPHSLQAIDVETGFEFTRSLSSDYPRRPYRRRTGELKTVIHWGQRKLLLSEIEFLLLANEPTAVVIYAGAAPGTHVKILEELFPENHFVLVDPANFTVRESRSITLINKLFTNKLAKTLRRKYPNSPILFISDVRSGDQGLDDDAAMQAKVESDMNQQAEWHEILEAEKSMLKFRLPYTPGRTRYLDGDIRLPIWGPITTECRLIVNRDARWRMYDHKKHEEQLFFFNTVARPALYAHPVTGATGIDHCYDCTGEVLVLKKYFKSIGQRDHINRRIASLSERISTQLSHDRTLADPNPDPGVRADVIRRHQWVNGRPAYAARR